MREERSAPGTSASTDRPLSAVFFFSSERGIDPMLRGWLEAGRAVAAIVMPSRSKRRRTGRRMYWPPWNALSTARRSGAQVILLDRPVDWDRLIARLRPTKPDVLICFGFPSLIPEHVVQLFRHGGINFHPALLPYYRGPSPFQRLIIDNTWRDHGGVTLHVMTDRYDEGDIIAQIAFAPEDWKSTHHLRRVLARALKTLAGDPVAKYCAGEIRLRAQPKGTFPWASFAQANTTVAADWTSDYLKILCAFTRRPGVFIETKTGKIRLSRQIAAKGPPTGAPHEIRRFTVAFDLADARVVCTRYSKFERRMTDLRESIAALLAPPKQVPCRYDLVDRAEPR